MENMTNSISNERFMTAAINYLERNGYNVINFNSMFDIIATDGNVLVFIDVIGSEYSFAECSRTRSEFERDALMYLATHDDHDINIKFRFDAIKIAALGGDKAGLAHHVNAYS